MSTKFFRDLYRAPLERTENKTISRHDTAKQGARAGGRRFTSESGKQAWEKGNAKRWANTSPEERRRLALLMVDARRRKTTPEQRSQTSRKGGQARWEAMTEEQRVEFRRKGAVARNGAPWPFPFTRHTDRARSLANLKRGPAAAGKARKLKRFLKRKPSVR